MLGKTDRERKSRSEVEMVRQPHQLNRQESEQTLGDGGGQRSLMYCFGGCRVEHSLATEQQENYACHCRILQTTFTCAYLPCFPPKKKKKWYVAPPTPMLLSKRSYLYLLWIPFPFT